MAGTQKTPFACMLVLALAMTVVKGGDRRDRPAGTTGGASAEDLSLKNEPGVKAKHVAATLRRFGRMERQEDRLRSEEAKTVSKVARVVGHKLLSPIARLEMMEDYRSGVIPGVDPKMPNVKSADEIYVDTKFSELTASTEFCENWKHYVGEYGWYHHDSFMMHKKRLIAKLVIDNRENLEIVTSIFKKVEKRLRDHSYIIPKLREELEKNTVIGGETARRNFMMELLRALKKRREVMIRWITILTEIVKCHNKGEATIRYPGTSGGFIVKIDSIPKVLEDADEYPNWIQLVEIINHPEKYDIVNLWSPEPVSV